MKKIINPNVNEIDLADETLSAFYSDGRGYIPVTPEMIGKISKDEIVITEYHETPLGNVIYISANSNLQ